MATPRSDAVKKDELDRTIRSLNTDFQLRLWVPDSTLSPSKQRQQIRTEEDQRVHRIYERARYWFFKDQAHLSTSIGRFREQAEQKLRDWTANKSRQDTDTPTSPFYDDPLRVNPGIEERAGLQKLLLSLLEVKRSSPHRPSSTSAPTPILRAKRGSPEFPAPDAKRCKDQAVRYNRSFIGESIDDIPVRTRTLNRPPSVSSNGSDTSTINGDVYSKAFSRSHTSLAEQSFVSSKDSYAPSLFSTITSSNESESQTTVHTSFSSFTSTGPFVSREPCANSFTSRLYGGVNLAVQPTRRLLNPPSVSDTSEVSVPSVTNGFVTNQAIPASASRASHTWPQFPIPYLNQAPLIIVWELTRAARYCNVDLSLWDLPYRNDQSWHDHNKFRGKISTHPLFIGKSLPPSCDLKTWTAGLSTFTVGPKIVSLAIELDLNEEKSGPLFNVQLKRPSLKLGHRLARRFGADRFLELLLPPRDSVKAMGDGGTEKIIKWLTDTSHYFLGRTWVPFYINEGSKTKQKATHNDEDAWDPDRQKVRSIVRSRIYLFAVDGNNFQKAQTKVPPLDEALCPSSRTKMRRCDLLSWAVNIENAKNGQQPITKLFSRFALSLSDTWPAVVLETQQIRRRSSDIRQVGVDGELGDVMNDGIGRISRSLARKVANALGLSDTPCGFQARIGSAKGMWIVDVEEDGLGDEDWIETFPSQEKWQCDFEDIHHRTFEVRDWPRELRTASLNKQFIPVLEAQAPLPGRMRKTIAAHLVNGIQKEIDEQREAMNHPADFRAWMSRTGSSSDGQSGDGLIPFLGGLPAREEDQIAYLLDAGFKPDENQFLHTIATKFRKRETERLKSKMNITIPQSTYAFMVVDFTGELGEGEVQLAFSSKFHVGEDSDTLLDGIDVLVARSPAHFASDIQKVRAVFKPSLRKLKDVIVFSTRGASPLADKLSGGDYDGDKAWVCWDPDIVGNFSSARVPQQPDLISKGYLRKFNPSFQSIRDTHEDMETACGTFLREAIAFGMQPSLLGICTKFKERHCYLSNSVNSNTAVALCTLVSRLVDQNKQGILFSEDDFKRLKSDMNMQGKDLEYEKDRSSSFKPRHGLPHILDHLKFEVARDAIEHGLRGFEKSFKKSAVFRWDPELADLFKEANDRRSSSKTFQALMEYMTTKIVQLAPKWTIIRSKKLREGSVGYKAGFKELFDEWTSIQLPPELVHSNLVQLFCDEWNGDPARSRLELLKASTAFKISCDTGSLVKTEMVWHLAGQQLCWIKAMKQRGRLGQSAVAVTPEMWAVLKPDSRKIKALAARREDNESAAALEETMVFDDDGNAFDDT